jgi:hypothetical protein
VKVVPIKASSVEETVQEIEKNLKTTFTKQVLVTEREPSACQEDCPTVTYFLIYLITYSMEQGPS